MCFRRVESSGGPTLSTQRKTVKTVSYEKKNEKKN